MEQIRLPNGGIAYIKTKRELEEEIVRQEELLILGKAISQLLPSTGPNAQAVATLLVSMEQRKISKQTELSQKTK